MEKILVSITLFVLDDLGKGHSWWMIEDITDILLLDPWWEWGRGDWTIAGQDSWKFLEIPTVKMLPRDSKPSTRICQTACNTCSRRKAIVTFFRRTIPKRLWPYSTSTYRQSLTRRIAMCRFSQSRTGRMLLHPMYKYTPQSNVPSIPIQHNPSNNKIEDNSTEQANGEESRSKFVIESSLSSLSYRLCSPVIGV